MNKHQIVIVGGGNAGISVAAQLLRQNAELDIAIIEPSSKHYYQPAWTLVGGGTYDINDTVRDEVSVIPDGVVWIKHKVTSFSPETNSVTIDDNSSIHYDYLVVAAGIQLNWDEIKGLKDTLGKNGVTSNYSFDLAPYTYELLKNLKNGKAIFTSPNTPIKCGGAPHKIMYLTADYLRKHNSLNNVDIQYWSGGTKLFAIPKYEKTLLEVVKRGNIKLNFHQKLVEVDGPNKKAKFIGIGEHNKDIETWVGFEMLHVTPPQSAPDFIRNSPLANSNGWVDANKDTLQHPKFVNVFSIGDVSGIPASKTGAAIRKQAPVVVKNILSLINHKELTAKYNGYSSCPIVTGYGKLMLAEFDYNNQPMETFPFEQSKERWTMYILKKYILPRLYWSQILKGKM